MPLLGFRRLAAGVFCVLLTPATAQEPVGRQTPRAGAIVSAKGGEELQFPREASWRPAVVRQDVVGGDTLRTGEIGTLGLTFTDQTTIRVGRQSTLVVNQIAAEAASGQTVLTMPQGSAWARASRGGSGVTVRTPAASAAIRGTDWSLTVNGDRTTLIVLEGVVELTNPQGSVTVREGEGATARIGERPSKIVLVRPEDREQMMFYIELRGLFGALPATPLDGSNRRAMLARLQAIEPARRSTEDWVAIAETALGTDRREVVLAAVAEARRRLGQRPAFVPGPEDWARSEARVVRSGRALGARLDLVEALLAASARRYEEAAALFARAQRGATGRRADTARCGYFAAAKLADPKRALPQPGPGNGDRNVCAAYLTAFAKGLPEAQAVLAGSGGANSRHLMTNLLSAQVALLLNQRDEYRARVERMREIDPESPETLLASGELKAYVDSDLDGAVAELTRAAEAAPGNAMIWNSLALALDNRGAPIEAEHAHRRGIAADPYDPINYANLAILLLDQSRDAEAGELIEKALALDPSFHAAYLAKGRYHLQRGETARAMEFMLAASAANPASAQGLLATAITRYMDGDVTTAAQALDNADRLDRNDPTTSIARTAIAVDQLDADAAISNAREAVRRYRNRGGFFATLASTRTGGSYLGQAYRLLGLEQWGRYYTDRVADPFAASSYFDQSLASRVTPFFTRPTLDRITGTDFADQAGNLVIQGLLLDPLAVAGRLGRLDLWRRPFVDVEFGGSLVRRNGRTGWQSEITVQAYGNEPVPVSVSLGVSQTRAGDRRGLRAGGETTRSATAFVGVAPSASDRFLLWGIATATDPDLVAPALARFDADRNRLKTYQAGAGWSHSFGYRHVLNATFVVGRADQSERRISIVDVFDPTVLPLPFMIDTRSRRDIRVDAATAAIGHMIGFGDFTLRSGVEGQRGTTRGFTAVSQTLSIPGIPGSFQNESFDPSRGNFRAGRAYTNLLWQPSDRVRMEAGLDAISYDTSTAARKSRVDPRVGIAVSPFEGQWLRAAWRRETELPNGFTLSPVSTVGLTSNTLPVGLGGRRETTALRWDAEWSPYLFTTVEYQRQRASALDLRFPDTVDSISIDRARIDYLAASANLWLTHGIGVFGTIGRAESRMRDAAGIEVDVPFIPRTFGRVGVRFVHPSRIQFAAVANYIGDRYDAPGGVKLGDFWTADVTASYETADRRFLFSLALLNAFDKRYELVAPRAGFSEAVLGAGRTLAGSLKVRF